MLDPSRRRIRRIVLIVLLPALGVALAEMTLRVVHSTDPASLPAAMAPKAPDDAAAAEGLPTFQTAADLKRPNIRGLFRGRLHRTDAAGFRGPLRKPVTPPNTRRVIVTGDSIAMGSGVDEMFAFPAATELLLNESHSPPQWEVLNASLAGANTATALNRLEKGIEAYAPDIYVYAFVLDDIRGPAYKTFPAERTALNIIGDAGWPARSSSLLIREITWKWLGIWDEIQSLNLDHYAHTIEYNYFENPPAWRHFVRGLDRFAAISQREDRCSLMLMVTRLEALDPERHPYLPAYGRVAGAARARGIEVVETTHSMLGRDGDAIRHSRMDPHPNEEGHAIFAEVLTEAILRLPETCWNHPRRANQP